MLERVANVLKEFVDDDTEITMDSSLVDDLGLSSLQVIQIAAEFESEFDVEIPDRIIPSLRTVGDIVDYLEKNAE